MSRELSQHESLSCESIGVMAYLLSKPDNWEAQTNEIERHFRIGREKRQRIFRELENTGYLERIEFRIAGKFDYQITVHEIPLAVHERTKETSRERKPPSDEPQTSEPSTEKPSTVNPSTYMKTEVQEIDLNKTDRQTDRQDRPETAASQPAVVCNSVFEFSERLAYAMNRPKIADPQRFAKWLGNGEQDEEIKLFLQPVPTVSNGNGHKPIESQMRDEIERLRTVNTGCEYGDQALFDDLKYHFEQLGKWNEVLARKLLYPKGE